MRTARAPPASPINPGRSSRTEPAIAQCSAPVCTNVPVPKVVLQRTYRARRSPTCTHTHACSSRRTHRELQLRGDTPTQARWLRPWFYRRQVGQEGTIGPAKVAKPRWRLPRRQRPPHWMLYSRGSPKPSIGVRCGRSSGQRRVRCQAKQVAEGRCAATERGFIRVKAPAPAARLIGTILGWRVDPHRLCRRPGGRSRRPG
jgi:hypothetical protein